MQIIQLEWEYLGTEFRLWKGLTTGMLSNIRFTLSLTDRFTDEYLITANIRSIANASCFGLDNAKMKAQDLINSYALSQAIL